MNRRTFIQAAGLGLTGRFGFAERGQPIAVLLKLLEDSPRERVVPELVRMIRTNLRYEDLLAALSLAAVRNVQPYPEVGFKYHSVLVLRSIHLATQHISSADKWLPIVWAADYFKDTQAQERATGGWRPPMKRVAPGGNPQAVRRELATALENWDPEAADIAIVRYVRAAPPDEIFSLLFPYGARDLRAIGHKAITVSNAHTLIALLGSAQAEPMLRSTVAALQNTGGGPNPANHELQPDQPWRRNRKQLRNIPQSWNQGRDDPGARTELHATLYRVSPEEAGAVVAGFLRRGLSPEAIWRVLFDMAAELIMHGPSIVLLHAQTTANALHYAYRVCGNEQTQQLMLLQCAAFIATFRQMTDTIQPDLGLEALQPIPLEGVDAIGEISADLSTGQRLQAVRKSLGYLQKGGDAEALIANARHYLVYNADEAHDYKFSEAVFDGYSHLPDFAWRCRFLSAGMAYFKAPRKRPNPVVEETMELLHG